MSRSAAPCRSALTWFRQWRGRWLAGQAIPLTELTAAERLQDLPRAGKPSAITADQLVPNHGPGVREAGAIGGRPITNGRAVK